MCAKDGNAPKTPEIGLKRSTKALHAEHQSIEPPTIHPFKSTYLGPFDGFLGGGMREGLP